MNSEAKAPKHRAYPVGLDQDICMHIYIYYTFYLSTFTMLQSMSMSGCLITVPALGTLFLLLGFHDQLQYNGFCFILIHFIFLGFVVTF